MVAAFACASTAHAQSTDSLLDRAARTIASARSLKSSFEQTLTNPDIHETKTSRGEFVQQGAARFAFRFTDPAGDAIVADGSAIWVYLPSASRGQAIKLPIAQGAQLDLLTQLLTAPRSNYVITDGGASDLGGRPVQMVTLKPKAEGMPFQKATLWLDRESALVRQLEAVEPSGLIRRIRFTDIRTDVDLPKDALTFVVPPDVKVLDASGLFGIKPPKPPR
jgi:outer membrane lipoprotein carrier protein